jgi:hypothetical protein
LRIGGDVRIILDAHSRALEKGRVQLDGGKDYRVVARTIQASSVKPQSRVIVAVAESSGIEVKALGASVRVANPEGVHVAHVAAGRAVELRLAPATGTAVLTGCVLKAGPAHMLRDEVSRSPLSFVAHRSRVMLAGVYR